MEVAARVASVGSVSDGMAYLRARDPLERMLWQAVADRALEWQEIPVGNGFARAWNGDG